MKKILICGQRSFVASGLAEKMEAKGYDVETFSRGEEQRKGKDVTGDVYMMDDNPHFADEYESVINFIIIKNEGIEKNLRYIEALHRFCEKHKVKRLIQISSISVYPNIADYVDENSPIETNPDSKGGYASIKVAVDNWLIAQKKTYQVVYVRPGYIISDDKPVSLVGILRPLGSKIGLLLGNKKTSLPLVKKDLIHESLVRIVSEEHPAEVYLLLENRDGKKIDLVRKHFGGKVIKLPKGLTLAIAKLLKAVGVFKFRHYQQVLGLFKDTYYDSSETEYNLQLSFDECSIAVIGSGAYGSYVVNKLNEVGKSENVTLIEIGDNTIKDEDGIGVGTNLTGANYTGLKSGRFFCFGGATRKWGGQLLTFSKNDISHPTQWMKDITELDEKYKDKIFGRFGFKNIFEEKHITKDLFTKTGTWLGYFNRNLYGYLKAGRKAFVKSGYRVSRLIVEPDTRRILGLEMVTKDGKIKHAYYSYYFLTAGAFESNRIILSSGLADSIHFSDHLSQKVFEIKGKPVIGGEDYQFGVQGTSLITKRMIGEVNDVSFFANPIFNADFPLFQNMKQLMFKGNFSLRIIGSIIKDIPSAFGFAWSMFVKKKIYVYKNKWHIFIDIENACLDSNIKLAEEKDKWGVNKLDVNFVIGEGSKHVYDEATRMVKGYLDKNEVNYTVAADEIHVEKSEDTYHPYGMFLSDCASKDEYYNYFPNMLMINTGILPRAGGINTTATCFPLIEDFIDNRFCYA